MIEWLSYDVVRFKIELGVDAKFICKNVPLNEHDGHFDNDATRQPCFRPLAVAHGRSRCSRPLAAEAHWLCVHEREAFWVSERNVNNKHCERVNVTMPSCCCVVGCVTRRIPKTSGNAISLFRLKM